MKPGVWKFWGFNPVEVTHITEEDDKIFLHVGLNPQDVYVDQVIVDTNTETSYTIIGIERRNNWVDRIVGPHLALRIIKTNNERNKNNKS